MEVMPVVEAAEAIVDLCRIVDLLDDFESKVDSA